MNEMYNTRNALHNLSAKENGGVNADYPTCRYCQGIVVGLVSALMDLGSMTYDQALWKVAELMPIDALVNRLPAAWRDDIAERVQEQGGWRA